MILTQSNFAQVTTILSEEPALKNTELDVKAEYDGGMEKFYKYIFKNFKPPKEVLNGTIFITFIIEKDGSISNINVVKDLGWGSGQEAIRVMKKCKKWKPGEKDGKLVRSIYGLPISIHSEKL